MAIKDVQAYYQTIVNNSIEQYNNAVKKYFDDINEIRLDMRDANTFTDWIGAAQIIGAQGLKGYKNAFINFGSSISNLFVGFFNDLYETGNAFVQGDVEEGFRDLARTVVNPTLMLAEAVIGGVSGISSTSLNLIGAIGGQDSSWNEFFQDGSKLFQDINITLNKVTDASRAFLEGEINAFNALSSPFNTTGNFINQPQIETQNIRNQEVINQEMQDTQLPTLFPTLNENIATAQQGILEKPIDSGYTYADFVKSNGVATLGFQEITDKWVDDIFSGFGLFGFQEGAEEAFGGTLVFETLKGIMDSVGAIYAMRSVGNMASKSGLSPAQVQASSQAFFFGNIAGKSINDALEQGADIQDAFSYGLSIAASETAIENLMGIKFGPINNSVATRGVWNFIKNGLEEGVEEVIAEFVQPGYENILTGEQIEIDPAETLVNSITAFASGFAASSIINVGQSIVLNNTVDKKNEKFIEKFDKYKAKYGAELALEKYKTDIENLVEYINKPNARGQIYNENGSAYIATLNEQQKENIIRTNPILNFVAEKQSDGIYTINQDALSKLTEESFKNKVNGEIVNNSEYAINDSVFGVDLTDNGNFDIVKVSDMDVNQRIVYSASQKLNVPIALYKSVDPTSLTEGKYGENGVFYLNANNITQDNAKDIVLDIAKHEAIHALKSQMPDVFESLTDTVTNLVTLEYDKETGMPIVSFANKDIEKALPTLQNAIESSFRSYVSQNVPLEQILGLMNEELPAYFVEQTITDAALIDVIGDKNPSILESISRFFGIEGSVETNLPMTSVKRVNKDIKNFANTWRSAMQTYTKRSQSIVAFVERAFGSEAKAMAFFTREAVQQYGANKLNQAMKETYEQSTNSIELDGQRINLDAITNLNFDFSSIRPEKYKTLTDEELNIIFEYDIDRSGQYYTMLRRYETAIDEVIDFLPRKSVEFKEARQRLNTIEKLVDQYRDQRLITPNENEMYVVAEAFYATKKAEQDKRKFESKKQQQELKSNPEKAALKMSATRFVNVFKSTAFEFKNKYASYGGAVFQQQFENKAEAEDALKVVEILIENYKTAKEKPILRGKYNATLTYDSETKIGTIVSLPTQEFIEQQLEKRAQKEAKEEQDQNEEEVNVFVSPEKVSSDFNIELTEQQRKDIQKYYTNEENTKKTFDTVVGLFQQAGLDINTYTIIESSAGNGAFLKVFNAFNPDIKVEAYDIKPEAENIIEQDFLTLEKEFSSKNIVIGNPPFKNKLDEAFINKSLEIAPTVAFIIPMTWNGSYQKQKGVNPKARLIASIPLGTQPFFVGKEEAKVKVVIQVWTIDRAFNNMLDLRITSTRPSTHPDFDSRILDGNEKNYDKYRFEFGDFDFAVRTIGNYRNFNQGFTSWDQLARKSRYMVFKTNNPTVLKRIKNIDFQLLSLNGSTHVQGFRAYDVISSYQQLLENSSQEYTEFDLENNGLTETQVEYFKRSKIRQEGKLVPLYHGSLNTDIQSFSKEFYGKKTGVPDKYIFFTNDFSTANNFSKEYAQASSKFIQTPTGKEGKVYNVYLDMRNPLDLRNLSAKDIQFITEAYAESYGETLVEAKESMKRMNFNNHQMVKIAFTGDQVREAGYDGLIAEMYPGTGIYEYGVFNGDQIKAIENKNPEISDNIYDEVRPEKTKTRPLTEEERVKISDIFANNKFIDTYFEVNERGNYVAKAGLVRSGNIKRNYAKINQLDKNNNAVVSTYSSSEYAVNVDVGYDFVIDIANKENKKIDIVKLDKILNNPATASIYHTLKSLGIRFIGYEMSGNSTAKSETLGFSVTRNQNDAVFINFKYLTLNPAAVFETIFHELTHEIFKTNRESLIDLATIYRNLFFTYNTNTGKYDFTDAYLAFDNEFQKQNFGRSFIDYLKSSYKDTRKFVKTPDTLFKLLNDSINGNININNDALSSVSTLNEFLAQITGYLISSKTLINEVFKVTDYEKIRLFNFYENILKTSNKNKTVLMNMSFVGSSFHNAYLAHEQIMQSRFPNQKVKFKLAEANEFIRTFTDGKFNTRSQLFNGLQLELQKGKKGEATFAIQSIIQVATKLGQSVKDAVDAVDMVKKYFNDQLDAIQQLIDNPEDAAYINLTKMPKAYKSLARLVAKSSQQIQDAIEANNNGGKVVNLFDDPEYVNNFYSKFSDFIDAYSATNDSILDLFDLENTSVVEDFGVRLEQENIDFLISTDNFLQSPKDQGTISQRLIDTLSFLRTYNDFITTLNQVNNLSNAEYKVLMNISKLQADIFDLDTNKFYLILKNAVNRTFNKINTGNQAKSKMNQDLIRAFDAIQELLKEIKKPVINQTVFKTNVLKAIQQLDTIITNSDRIIDMYAVYDERTGKIDRDQTIKDIREKYVFDIFGFYGSVFNEQDAIYKVGKFFDYDNQTVESLGYKKNYYSFAKSISKLFFALETEYLSVFGEIPYKDLAEKEKEALLNIQGNFNDGIPMLKKLSEGGVFNSLEINTRQDILKTYDKFFSANGTDFFKKFYDLYLDMTIRRTDINTTYDKQRVAFLESHKDIERFEYETIDIPDNLTYGLKEIEYNNILFEVEESRNQTKSNLDDLRLELQKNKKEIKENNKSIANLIILKNKSLPGSKDFVMANTRIADIRKKNGKNRQENKRIQAEIKAIKDTQLSFQTDLEIALVEYAEQNNVEKPKMYRGQLVDLYMKIKREESMHKMAETIDPTESRIKPTRHFEVGGSFQLFDNLLVQQKSYEKAKSKAKEKKYIVIKTREEMLATLESFMSEDPNYQILIDEARRVYKQNYEYVNEIYRAKFQTDLPREEFYSPFRTIDSDWIRDFELKRKNKTNIGAADGFTLETTMGASTPLAIETVTSVMEGTTTAAANYSYERLITDFQSLSVAKVDKTNNTFSSILASLDGDSFQRFFTDTFTDVLGYGLERLSLSERAFNEVQNLSISASMALSLSVYVKQFISLVKVSSGGRLNFNELLFNVARHGIPFYQTELRKWLIDNNSNIYERVQFGGVANIASTTTAGTFSRYRTGIRNLSNNIKQLFSKFNNHADSTVLVAAFATLVNKTQKENPNLSKEQVLEKANDIFTKTTLLYDVANTDTAFRSKFSTGKGPVKRYVSKYMSENILQLSNVVSSIRNYRLGVVDIDEVTRALFEFIASAFLSAIVGSAFSKLNGYVEDDEILEDFLVNELLLQNIIGSIPYLNLVTSLFQFQDGNLKQQYEVRVPLVSDVTRILNESLRLVNTIGDIANGEAKPSKIFRDLIRIIESTGNLTGIPFSNIRKITSYILKLETEWFGGSSYYDFEEFFYSRTNAQQLGTAVSKNDEEKIAFYIGRTIENTGVKDEILYLLKQLEDESISLRFNAETFQAKSVSGDGMTTFNIPERTKEKYKILSQRAIAYLIKTPSYKRKSEKEKLASIQRILNYYYNFMKNEILVQEYKGLTAQQKRDIDYDSMRRKKILDVKEVIANALRDY